MVGLDVSPVTDSSSMYRCSVPVFSRSRVMLSSQRLWPWSWSVVVAFMVSPPPGSRHRTRLHVPDVRRVLGDAAVAGELSRAGHVQDGLLRPRLRVGVHRAELAIGLQIR